MTFVVDVPEMLYAIKVIRPHVGTDDSLPILEQVFVQFTGRDLWFTATDRFTIGCYRLGGECPPSEPYEMMLSKFDLRMIEMLSRNAGRKSFVSFNAPPNPSGEGYYLDFQNGRYRSETPTSWGSFPDLRKVLAELSAGVMLLKTDRSVRYDPAKLARFAHLSSPLQFQQAIRKNNLESSSYRPALITANRFIGAIMPLNGPPLSADLPPERVVKP